MFSEHSTEDCLSFSDAKVNIKNQITSETSRSFLQDSCKFNKIFNLAEASGQPRPVRIGPVGKRKAVIDNFIAIGTLLSLLTSFRVKAYFYPCANNDVIKPCS